MQSDFSPSITTPAISPSPSPIALLLHMGPANAFSESGEPRPGESSEIVRVSCYFSRLNSALTTTDIMLQMVAGGRGVAALPRWLAQEYESALGVVPVRLGPRGIAKQIFVGAREADTSVAYLRAFIELARLTGPAGPPA
ncbi:MAG: hypothetical protein GJU76_08715 [Gallionella sp.]|nr:hypothetical protein [Gallionella sp.]